MFRTEGEGGAIGIVAFGGLSLGLGLVFVGLKFWFRFGFSSFLPDRIILPNRKKFWPQLDTIATTERATTGSRMAERGHRINSSGLDAEMD